MRIVLLGAGNVGYHLGNRFQESGATVVQVFSRSEAKARLLADKLGCSFTNQLSQIQPDADLYIIAVKDDAIQTVAGTLLTVLPPDAFVVHTSGSVPVAALAPFFQRRGSFYPLQTFSTAQTPDFRNVPLCIDAAPPTDIKILETLATQIGSRFYRITDPQRAVLHVAAVFANNFTNHLYYLAGNILEKENIPFDLLKPLIAETALKVQQHPPREMQTGPAIRHDRTTIGKHLEWLQSHSPELAGIYREMTASIQAQVNQDVAGYD